MRIKKQTFSTKLLDLYGKDGYQSHIEIGREYWCYFSKSSNIGKKYGSNWYKIIITYIRSGCIFYSFTDYKDIDEEFCPLNCFMTSTFQFATINPEVDLSIDNIKEAKLLYRFDDTRTIVQNWKNGKYTDIKEEKYYDLFRGKRLIDTLKFKLKSKL